MFQICFVSILEAMLPSTGSPLNWLRTERQRKERKNGNIGEYAIVHKLACSNWILWLCHVPSKLPQLPESLLTKCITLRCGWSPYKMCPIGINTIVIIHGQQTNGIQNQKTGHLTKMRVQLHSKENVVWPLFGKAWWKDGNPNGPYQISLTNWFLISKIKFCTEHRVFEQMTTSTLTILYGCWDKRLAAQKANFVGPFGRFWISLERISQSLVK